MVTCFPTRRHGQVGGLEVLALTGLDACLYVNLVFDSSTDLLLSASRLIRQLIQQATKIRNVGPQVFDPGTGLPDFETYCRTDDQHLGARIDP